MDLRDKLEGRGQEGSRGQREGGRRGGADGSGKGRRREREKGGQVWARGRKGWRGRRGGAAGERAGLGSGGGVSGAGRGRLEPGPPGPPLLPPRERVLSLRRGSLWSRWQDRRGTGPRWGSAPDSPQLRPHIPGLTCKTGGFHPLPRGPGQSRPEGRLCVLSQAQGRALGVPAALGPLSSATSPDRCGQPSGREEADCRHPQVRKREIRARQPLGLMVRVFSSPGTGGGPLRLSVFTPRGVPERSTGPGAAEPAAWEPNLATLLQGKERDPPCLLILVSSKVPGQQFLIRTTTKKVQKN